MELGMDLREPHAGIAVSHNPELYAGSRNGAIGGDGGQIAEVQEGLHLLDLRAVIRSGTVAQV